MILWLATTNQNKVKEIESFFKSYPHLQFKYLKDLDEHSSPEETGKSFKDNAEIKSRHLFKILKEKSLITKDTLVLGEDSGLEVKALNGAPGIYSARYSGDEATNESNNELLLKNLERETNRQARYVCGLSVIDAQEKHYYFEGYCEGSIAHKLSGDQGFGYDPLFIPTNQTQTLGCLPPEFKQSISHRSKALKQFKEHIIQSVSV